MALRVGVESRRAARVQECIEGGRVPPGAVTEMSREKRGAVGSAEGILSRRGARTAITVIACAAALLVAAAPASAKDEFEDGFKDELGRIAAHEAVGAGRAMLGYILLGHPGHYGNNGHHDPYPYGRGYHERVVYYPVEVHHYHHHYYRKHKHHHHHHHYGYHHGGCDHEDHHHHYDD
jgi:hypothetical protein